MAHWINQKLNVMADLDVPASVNQLNEFKQLLNIKDTHVAVDWEMDFNLVVPMPDEIKNAPYEYDEVLSEQLLSPAIINMTIRDFMSKGPVELLNHIDFNTLDEYSRFDDKVTMGEFIDELRENVAQVQSRFLRGYYHKRVNHPGDELVNPSVVILRIRELADKAIDRESNIAKYGYSNAYEWAYANWGVKTNARDGSVEEVAEDSVTLYFETVWQPPEIIYERLSERFPELNFSVMFVDETGMFGGSISYMAGSVDNYWTTSDAIEVRNIALNDFDIAEEDLVDDI